MVFIPAVIFGIWLLLQIFPAIDPRRANYPGFRRTYWLLGNTLLVFLAAAHGLLLAGVAEPDRWLVAGAGLIAVVIGNFLGRVEPNWFVGLRTPWTLESDVVWHRTHRLVGRLLERADERARWEAERGIGRVRSGCAGEGRSSRGNGGIGGGFRPPRRVESQNDCLSVGPITERSSAGSAFRHGCCAVTPSKEWMW